MLRGNISMLNDTPTHATTGLPDHRRKKKKWHPSWEETHPFPKNQRCTPSTINPAFKILLWSSSTLVKLILELISRSILLAIKEFVLFQSQHQFCYWLCESKWKKTLTTEAGDFQQARVQQGVHTTNLQTPPQNSLRNKVIKGKLLPKTL